MRAAKRQVRLPGDLTREAYLDRAIRVDHAGEYGATRIYAGQMSVLKKSRHYAQIKHMAEQEDVHLETFEKIMTERRARPTALMPLWHVAGFALGAGTALLGEKAAMACTVAVESVIEEHYARQAQALGEEEPELRQTIEKFREEELEHHDTGLEEGAEQTPFYGLLSGAIKAGCRTAIWLSERI